MQKISKKKYMVSFECTVQNEFFHVEESVLMGFNLLVNTTHEMVNNFPNPVCPQQLLSQYKLL